MQKNLVIVESPAKAKTIGKFLGSDYTVTSCMGHIRDLEKKDLGINLEKNYQPNYIVTPDKKKIVADLKKLAKEAETVWLASDEDREGEAIAWHLKEVLKLKPEKTRRIAFHEITKEAIQRSIKNPRSIDDNLVNAQQARRVLDRIVGFMVSPVLWKKVKPALSAGRVQSVAVRLIVEREREIMNFKTETWFRVTGSFLVQDENDNPVELKAELNKRFSNKKEAQAFLEKCKSAEFMVADVVKRPAKRYPAQPFTTSTLQQEASRKLGFSVSRTMAVAQRLYESGKITYMRTDSVNLSDLALTTAKQKITELHGEKYVKIRKYQTKSKGAQEAHEAIRPTYMNQESVDGNPEEKRLYDLIWKRTMASQMADAELERTTVTISVSTAPEVFTATGEVIVFDGFLKVYMESSDDENGSSQGGGHDIIPPLKAKEILRMASIVATKRFSQRPYRYTEASLVKKLEELGIGRPSTYAPTITTIQNRNYVIRQDHPGESREYEVITLKNNEISEKRLSEISGSEKSKLFPTDVGMVVNDFLVENFEQIMDYNFTADVEKTFDDIAAGKEEWSEIIDKFYQPFNRHVDFVLETSERTKGERILGKDPKTGKEVSVKIGRYGPVAQLGESSNENEKPQFASLLAGQHLETITLEETLELFRLPRELGEYEGKKVIVNIGRFGPYVRHDNKFTSLQKQDDPYTINLDRAIVLIEEKREKDRKAVIKVFDEEPEIRVLNGRWGPYISYNKKNYKIPKKINAEELTLEECRKIIDSAPEPKTRNTRRKS